MKAKIENYQSTILVVDDTASDRLLLTELLKSAGYRILSASSGLEALNLFNEHNIDMLLLDIMMPDIDGREVAKQVRESTNSFVPIVFITGLDSVESVADLLMNAGDDFITKPYNPILLNAKIKSFLRMRNLQLEVMAQREHLHMEQVAAKSIFDKIAHLGSLSLPNIRYMLSPVSVFNGDVLLAAEQPSGDLLVFVGDFTGHGLPAAVGIMPLAEIFYSMVKKGYGLEAILREINARLKNILPVSIFCCATAVHINYRQKLLEIWAGGLPEGVIYNSDTGRWSTILSNHVPLGILPENQFIYKPYLRELEESQMIYLWTDGLIEASNSLGEALGTERIYSFWNDHVKNSDTFSNYLDFIYNFTQKWHHEDDFTLVEIKPKVDFEVLDSRFSDLVPLLSSPSIDHWSFEYSIFAESLRSQDPIPIITHILMQAPALRPHIGVVNTILSELYSNALDHGILQLSSKLKNSAEGFKQYYKLRNERLEALREGVITVQAELESKWTGGVLRLTMIDSGEGFDFKVQSAENTPSFYGRGLLLLSTLCHKIDYFDNGNKISIEYVWDGA